MDEQLEVHVVARRNNFWHVNKKLLPIKGYYFALLAAVGALLPFMSIYMKSLNLTSSETGILYGTMPFVAFFVRSIVGVMTDHWHRHKLALVICSLLTGFFHVLILLIPARVHPRLTVHADLECNVQDSYLKDCVSLSAHQPDHSTCHMGLAEFAGIIINSNSTDSELDCRVHCSDIMDAASQTADLCFTNETEEFVKQCTGLFISHLPFEFQFLNVSHMLQSEITQNRTNMGRVQCRDYDLKLLQHAGQRYWQLLCGEESTFTCDIFCQKHPLELCQVRNEYDSTFYWLFLVYFIANLPFAPLFSLADSAAFDSLDKKYHKFGEQRLWGTIGLAGSAITSTFIMHMKSVEGSTIDYTMSFYIFTTLCCIAAIIAYFMDLSSNIKCGNIFVNFLALLRVPQVLLFLLVVLFFGITTGAIEGFLFWYLSDLGASTLVFGFCLVTNCLLEVPFLFMSGFIIKRTGAVPCLYLAFLAVTVRFLGYSFLQDPWLVLLIEPLHGVTFGLMWAAVSTNAAVIAPPGMSATIQGVVGGIHFGIGKALGSLLMGFLFGLVGERWAFRVLALVSVCLLALYALVNHCAFKSHTELSSLQNQQHKAGVCNDQPLLSGSEGISSDTQHSQHSEHSLQRPVRS